MKRLPSIELFLALIALATILIGSQGCGGGESDSVAISGGAPLRWSSFPIILYAHDDIVADPALEDDLIAAIDFWNDAGSRFRSGLVLFTYGGRFPDTFDNSALTDDTSNFPFPAVLEQSSWPFADTDALAKTVRSQSGAKIVSAAIALNTEHHNFCLGDCGVPGDKSARKVLAHELGHFIGLDAHNEDPTNILFDGRYEFGDLSQFHIGDAQLSRVVPQ